MDREDGILLYMEVFYRVIQEGGKNSGIRVKANLPHVLVRVHGVL